jgi:CBS domain-containing protein
MTAKDLINFMIPHLKPDDSLAKARSWMADFKTTELPVAEEGTFLGLLDEDDLHENAQACLVEDVPLRSARGIVDHRAHYYSVLSVAYNQGVRMVAVLDDHRKYMGVVSIPDVVEAFAQSTAVQAEGAILVLRLLRKDYSLANIAAIVESDDAKVLSSHLAIHPVESEYLRLTLKLDIEDVQQIKSVLSSKGYEIEASFNTTDFSYDEKERLDLLMKYLTP